MDRPISRKTGLPQDAHATERHTAALRPVWRSIAANKHGSTQLRWHTAASMMLARTGEVEKTAFALGNSEAILRKHYMALVTKADAEKFWKLAS